MNAAKPRVTVFVPVYNREKYIQETIHSVLNQEYKDVELLLIDDGSQDRSAELIQSIKDPRIRLLSNPTNLGIPKTRNRGIQEARGDYIAMLDSDDLMRPNRLSLQVRFLDTHPDHAGVGSWSQYIDGSGKIISNTKTRPISDRRVRASLLFHCAIHNRTFTARSGILQQLGYNNDFSRCQDYELLARIDKQWKLHNLPRVLVYGRKHPEQITQNTSQIGDQKKISIASSLLTQLGVNFTPQDVSNHLNIARISRLNTIDEDYLNWLEEWLTKLLKANAQTKVYDRIAFSQIVAKMWLRAHLKQRTNLGTSHCLHRVTRSSLIRTLPAFLYPPYC